MLKNYDLLSTNWEKNSFLLKFRAGAGKGEGIFQPGVHLKHITALTKGETLGGALGVGEGGFGHTTLSRNPLTEGKG